MEADHQIEERKCPLQATRHKLAFKSFKLYKSCSVHITVFAPLAHFLVGISRRRPLDQACRRIWIAPSVCVCMMQSKRNTQHYRWSRPPRGILWFDIEREETTGPLCGYRRRPESCSLTNGVSTSCCCCQKLTSVTSSAQHRFREWRSKFCLDGCECHPRGEPIDMRQTPLSRAALVFFVCAVSDPAERLSLTDLHLSGSSFCQMEKVWIRDWKCAFHPSVSFINRRGVWAGGITVWAFVLSALRGGQTPRSSCLDCCRCLRLRRKHKPDVNNLLCGYCCIADSLYNTQYNVSLRGWDDKS